VYHGPPKKTHDYSMKLFEERGHAATGNYEADDLPMFFDMEMMIRAKGEAQARQVVNLLIAAMAVLEGAITFGVMGTGQAPNRSRHLSRPSIATVTRSRDRQASAVIRQRWCGRATPRGASSFRPFSACW
jgi:hypothetical protein